MPSDFESLVSVGGGDWPVRGGLSILADGDATVVVGLPAGAETGRGESNEGLRGGNGGALEVLEGRPSKVIRGELSCGGRLDVWSGE
jgi:hypothetical protein